MAKWGISITKTLVDCGLLVCISPCNDINQMIKIYKYPYFDTKII